MKEIIKSNKADSLGNMLRDYFQGKEDAFVEVNSITLDMYKMQGSVMFRSFKEMNYIEKKALGLCKGKVLDIGAGGIFFRVIEKF